MKKIKFSVVAFSLLLGFFGTQVVAQETPLPEPSMMMPVTKVEKPIPTLKELLVEDLKQKSPKRVEMTVKGAEARAILDAAFIDWMCMWDEEASRKFAKVVELDPDCVIGQWGLAMSTISAQDEDSVKKNRAHFDRLAKMLESPDKYSAGELALLDAFSRLYVGGSSEEAGTLYRQLGALIPGDNLPQLFECFFGPRDKDADGRPNPIGIGSKKVLESAIAKDPKDIRPLFIRLMFEEAVMPVSADLVELVEKIKTLAPDYAPACHIVGHYYFKMGKYKEAEELFAKAGRLFAEWQRKANLPYSSNDWYFRSMGYLAVAQICQGNKDSAMRVAQELSKIPIDLKRPNARGTIIQLWDSASLPLRLFYAYPPEKLVQKDIMALVPKQLPDGQPHRISELPTVAAVQALGVRFVRMNKRPSEELLASLQMLQNVGSMNEDAMQDAYREGSMFPYYRRGVELVSRLFCESNAVAYPTSSERWIEATLEFPPAPTGLMAPILPYPVEYRMADLFFWQKKYPEALKACDAALQKFPNLDCIIKLKAQIEKKQKEK